MATTTKKVAVVKKATTAVVKKAKKAELLFENKTFVITGTFQDYERTEIEELITSKGGLVKGSVSSKTDYLICGEKAGSKLAKAEELGITIISEEEFKNSLNSENKDYGYVSKEILKDAYWASVDGNLGIVKKYHYAIVDKKGKVIIPFEYDDYSNLDNDLISVRKNGKWAGFIDLKTQKKIDTIEQLVKAIKTNCDEKSYTGEYSSFDIRIEFKDLPLVKKFLNLDKNSINLSKLYIDNVRATESAEAEIEIKEPVVNSKDITAEEVLELSFKGMLDFEVIEYPDFDTSYHGGNLFIGFNFSGVNFRIIADMTGIEYPESEFDEDDYED